MEGNDAFFRTVRADFKMGLKFSSLLAVFGVVLGFCFDNWQDLKNFFITPLISGENPDICVLYYFFNAFSFGGVFSEYFATIMAAIPFAVNYCQETDGNMSIYKISRCGKYAYARSKFLVASILGGMTLFLGGLIFILALATNLPLVTPEQIFETNWVPFSRTLIIGNGWPYFAIMLYISFLGGALWASVGLCASAYFPSRYVAICAPFIFRFFLTQIGRLLDLPNGLRLEMLLCARGKIYSDTVTLVATTVAVFVLIFLCYHLFANRIERRIWDVE